LPVGATVAFPLDKVAPGFLELDGSVKSIAVYPDLAAFLGTAFNKGDEGAGNFRLPESRGEFLRGWDHGRGADLGRGIGSYQLGQNESHNHRYFDVASANIDPNGLSADGRVNGVVQPLPSGGFLATTGGDGQQVVSAANTVNSGGSEARPRNLAVMWCIKAWNAPINQGNIDVAALSALATQATETKLGTAKVATQALTDLGTDDATIVTPKKMRWGFGISRAANGYIILPTWLGGLIIQWGQINIGDIANGGSSSYSLPLAFPTNHFQTLLSCAESGGGAWNAFLVSKSLLGFVWSPMEWSAVVQNAKVTYLSIGS
jgi:microcystin-dependent protein